MTESAQPSKRAAKTSPSQGTSSTSTTSTGGAARAGESGGYGGGGGGGHGNGDGRPKQDPVLTQRFLDLDKALNGPPFDVRPQRLNWSGVNDLTVAFDSIKEALDAAFPVDRPTSDLPQASGGKQTGS